MDDIACTYLVSRGKWDLFLNTTLLLNPNSLLHYHWLHFLFLLSEDFSLHLHVSSEFFDCLGLKLLDDLFFKVVIHDKSVEDDWSAFITLSNFLSILYYNAFQVTIFNFLAVKVADILADQILGVVDIVLLLHLVGDIVD